MLRQPQLLELMTPHDAEPLVSQVPKVNLIYSLELLTVEISNLKLVILALSHVYL